MTIIHKHIDDIFEYDGSQINPSWAFNEFGIYGSSIITWVGPVNITPDNLKDFADVGLEIKSNYMINFICEFFEDESAKKYSFNTKELHRLACKLGVELKGVKGDLMLSAYLLRPSDNNYDIAHLCL